MRAIQLAKAALYAGVPLLMDSIGVDQRRQDPLAGAFGCHIDLKYAMVLGLIPDCDLAKVTVGRQRRRHRRAHRAAQPAARDEIEPRGAPNREDRNSGRAAFPAAFRRRHGDAPQDRALPNLRKAVTLPATKEIIATGEDEARRARRRRLTIASGAASI